MVGRVCGKSNKYSTDTNAFLLSLPQFREISNIHTTDTLKVEMVLYQYVIPEHLKVTGKIMNKKSLKGSS